MRIYSINKEIAMVKLSLYHKPEQYPQLAQNIESIYSKGKNEKTLAAQLAQWSHLMSFFDRNTKDEISKQDTRKFLNYLLGKFILDNDPLSSSQKQLIFDHFAEIIHKHVYPQSYNENGQIKKIVAVEPKNIFNDRGI